MTEITYTVKESRIKNSIINSLDSENGVLKISPGSDYHMIIISPIDGEESDATWGRFNFNIEVPDDFIYYVYILGSNYMFSYDELHTITGINQLGAKRFVSQNDILLYDITGRYLYLAIEIIGEGEGKISDIRVDKIGDNFMQTMPEIYQENDSFFHRYMSIYSSIYNDFGEDISRLHKLLDIDTAPAQFLIRFGHWLGIDIDCDIRDENVMRTLVKEAYELNKIKGTKAVVARLAEIMLGEEVTILEKNIMEQYQDEQSIEEFRTLFGDNVYNICILVNKAISESLKSQFMYILKQFVPVRARVQMVNLGKEGELDFHSYLDMNAKLFESREGSLDNEMALDHATTLME